MKFQHLLECFFPSRISFSWFCYHLETVHFVEVLVNPDGILRQFNEHIFIEVFCLERYSRASRGRETYHPISSLNFNMWLSLISCSSPKLCMFLDIFPSAVKMSYLTSFLSRVVFFLNIFLLTIVKLRFVFHYSEFFIFEGVHHAIIRATEQTDPRLKSSFF